MKKKPQSRRAPRRKERPARELHSAALGALGEGVLVLAQVPRREGLRIVYANAALCQLSGYAEQDLIGAAPGLLHVEPNDRERLMHWATGDASSPPLVGESFLRRKDGEMFSAVWTYSRMVAGRGKTQHLVALYRDTTERRGKQQIQGDARRMEAIGRLAGGVAHDFNNLISVINGYCEVLAPVLQAQPKALHDLTEIHNAGRKAAELTRQLLAVGRRQPFNARVIDLNQFVRESEAALTRLLGTEAKMAIELADDAGFVRTDPAQFHQVLLNLVLNARDALRDHGVITIRTAKRTVVSGRNRRATDPEPGTYAVLIVADNGTGMDKATLEHLFEPFFTTKPEGKGSGLGLALVYGAVQQSNGFINVHSELLVGSSFEIVLPQSTAPVEPRASAPLESIPAIPATRGHETVLVIEPDTVLRKMVAGILTTDGYRVIDAATPAEARNHIAALDKPVQLLVTNLDREQEKFAQALRRSTAGLRVLNICNHNAAKTRAWLPATQQAALPRPFALSELLKAARGLLDA